MLIANVLNFLFPNKWTTLFLLKIKMFLNIHLIKHRYFVCIYNELNIAHYIFKLLIIDKINLNLII